MKGCCEERVRGGGRGGGRNEGSSKEEDEETENEGHDGREKLSTAEGGDARMWAGGGG